MVDMKIKKYELLIVAAIVMADAFSKGIIVRVFEYGERFEVIKVFFWLTYLKNTGAAWSILEGQLWFFILISLVAMAGMIWYFLKTEQRQIILRVSLMFLFAGALGNFMDRLLLGYVRDFLSFKIFGYYFPVFNIADISLNVGVGLLILDALLEGKSEHGKS